MYIDDSAFCHHQPLARRFATHIYILIAEHYSSNTLPIPSAVMAEYAHYSIPDPEYLKVIASLPPQPLVNVTSMSTDVLAEITRKALSEVYAPMNRARYEPLVDGPSRTMPSSVMNSQLGLAHSVDLRS
jgi:hypothetical protein